MTYLFLGILALVFVLGIEKTKDLGRSMLSLEQRQNLLKRIAGFIAMSAWIHALPYILILIYMRSQHILSSELFNEDDATTNIIVLYILPSILLGTVSILALFKVTHIVLLKSTMLKLLTFRSKVNSLAVGMGVGTAILYLTYLLLHFVAGYMYDQAAFISLASMPIALYIFLTLTLPLSDQIRYYWTPFALIVMVTTSLVIHPATSELVKAELQAFRSGGLSHVVVTHDKVSFAGKLVLLTKKSAYIRVVLNEAGEEACFIRVSTDSALIAHSSSVERRSEGYEIKSPHGDVIEVVAIDYAPELVTKAAYEICGRPDLTHFGDWPEDAALVPSYSSSGAASASSNKPNATHKSEH
jgi:hypothetical protein